MINSSIYIENDSVIILEGLRDRVGNLITDATVTLESFVDRAGHDVDGVTVPATMSHTLNGDYEVIVSKDVELLPDRLYKATVKAISGGLQGQWTETMIAKYRVA